MSESALLRAVVSEIRAHNSSATYLARQVEVEFDEFAPATVGDLYIMVIPAGVEAGPTHSTSGGVIDRVYAVDVSIALRVPKKPRDRRREFLTDFRGTTSIGAHFAQHELNINEQIDFQNLVMTAANTLITAESGSNEGFIVPLKFAGVGPIREAPAEVFAGMPGESAAALIRTISFRGAQRIETLTLRVAP